MSQDSSLWKPLAIVPVPKSVDAVPALAEYARQLAPREVQQIVLAFDGGSYEMASSFVWQKTMAGLKKKLGSLGMDFIGEMLERKDVTGSSNAAQVLTDHDALRLAEELGFFPSTQTIRLRQAMEIIGHFADPPEDADQEGMSVEEAKGALRTCIQTVLGHTEEANALEFAQFRRELEARTFLPTDGEVASLTGAPYFYMRTTLRVLLAIIKTAQGAQLEHALANLNTFLPSIWGSLLHPDRMSVGWCYAEVHAEGRQTAATGVRTALLKVKGFDYVPETLRSRTFIDVAQKILDAHHSYSNYSAEAGPTRALAALGTTIPAPALARCMTALLAVTLGNRWGNSWAAEPVARQMLRALSHDRWVHYFNEVLPADDEILGKLMDENIARRFVTLLSELGLGVLLPQVTRSAQLVDAATRNNVGGVCAQATNLYNKLRT